MVTREQDFREVRRLLGDPREQRPTPDLIVSNLISAEQFLYNRMSGTGKPWTHNTISIVTVPGTDTYALVPASGPSFGKALFVYRDLGNGVIMPVPLTDFVSELQDQRYQFWVAQTSSGLTISGEKIAFYRNGNDAYLRIYPAPTLAQTYKIVYATGSLDWTTFDWADQPVLTEWSRYRQLLAALTTLAKCEWEGYTRQENMQYRQELRADLNAERAMHDAEFTSYLRNPNHEPSISEVGYYWE